MGRLDDHIYLKFMDAYFKGNLQLMAIQFDVNWMKNNPFGDLDCSILLSSVPDQGEYL